jgi:hypothetical protein
LESREKEREEREKEQQEREKERQEREKEREKILLEWEIRSRIAQGIAYPFHVPMRTHISPIQDSMTTLCEMSLDKHSHDSKMHDLVTVCKVPYTSDVI